jgi:hypothetical protein
VALAAKALRMKILVAKAAAVVWVFGFKGLGFTLAMNYLEADRGGQAFIFYSAYLA